MDQRLEQPPDNAVFLNGLITTFLFLFLTSQAPAAEFNSFGLKKGPLVLEASAAPRQHIEALGRQAGIWGSLEQDLEAWSYPFKLFDGFSLHLSTDDGATFVPLKNFASRQIATPHMSQMVFEGAGWNLTQTLFVPQQKTGMVMLFNARSRHDFVLAVRFHPSLAPMHRSVTKPLEASWIATRGELVFTERERNVKLCLGAPEWTRHQRLEDGRYEMQTLIRAASHARKTVPLLIAFCPPNRPSTKSAMNGWRQNTQTDFERSRRYYSELLDQSPQVISPDAMVNEALAWSVVSLDQLLIRNPFMGEGLVSGYSSSGRDTRPKYCWFFEEPTLTAWAYHRLGLSEHVRQALQLLHRYQREDGKPVHEVTQSLEYWPDFLKVSQHAYMHTDGSVYYLAGYGQYLRATGDWDFIRREWPVIRRILDWCFKVVDPTDGMLRIEPGDWGSTESSTGIWKDTQLEAMWAQALAESAGMARAMGEPELAERCQQTRAKVLAAIEDHFWSEAKGNYIWGLNRKEEIMPNEVPHHAVGFWLSDFRPDRIERALERMASADFRTDWGVRSLPMTDPQYGAQSYQGGSVWPVWTSGIIISDYRHGRAVEGFRTWMAMIRCRTLGGLGPMLEALDGQTFQRLKGAVPHQMFSELAVVNGFYDGLLGLEVDLPRRQIHLSPRLPPAWNRLEVKRIPYGRARLDLVFRQRIDRWNLTVDSGDEARAEWFLAPSLPAGTEVLEVTVAGKAWPYQVNPKRTRTVVELQLPAFAGKQTIEIRHQAGVSFMPVDEPLIPGAKSRNLRVVRAGLEGNEWQMRLEGIPGKTYPMRFFTERKLASVSDAVDFQRLKAGFQISLSAPPGAKTNAAGFSRWTVAIPFETRLSSSETP